MNKLWTPHEAGKVVPVVRVRPVVPPHPTIGVHLQGQHMHWQLGRYKERLTSGPGGLGRGKVWVVDQEAEQHNMVLTQTYDSLIGQYGFIALNKYAAVGTGSTPPSATQTGLVAELVRTILDENGNTSGTCSITRVADGVYEVSVVREFTEAQVGNKNLTEWGFSPASTAGANLMSRELFRDGGANPIVITPASDQRLRLIYKTRITFSPTTPTASSIDISGIGIRTGVVFLIGKAPTQGVLHSDLQLLDWFARGADSYVYNANTYYHRFALYNSRPALGYNSAGIGSATASHTLQYQSYVSGSRQRKTTTDLWVSSEANFSIQTIGLHIDANLSAVGLVGAFVLDTGQEFTKDNLHKLTIGEWTLTWGP